MEQGWDVGGAGAGPCCAKRNFPALQSRVPHLSDIPCCDFLSQDQLIRAAGTQGSLRALLVTEQGAVLDLT